MGFIIPFYIIFGTNLLTESLVRIAVFLPISVFRGKGISNGMKPSVELFLNKRNPGDLEWTSRKQQGRHVVGRRAPHPRGPLVAPPTYFFLLYIPTYPHTIKTDHKNLIPPPQPYVPV